MAGAVGHDARMANPGRSLDADEQAVLRFLLEADVPGATELREQVAATRVVGACKCGCPTVDLGTPTSAAPAPLADGPYPVEAEVVSDDGEPVGGVLLFVKDGRLDGLELYSYDRTPSTWPPMRLLRRVGAADNSADGS
jgi:hypothetical protein